MKFTQQLAAAQAANQSLLCVGLDPEPAKFPGAWRDDPARIYDFCAAIVAATKDLACAFKPQIAYFAAQRAEAQLERLIACIHETAPGVPVILDAKRGDIGSTAEQYAREAFERYQADAVTLSPFMGLDSIEPYMKWAGKGLILLCRTSNPGGSDLQAQTLANGELLFERIAKLAAGEWNAHKGGGQLGLVVGATFPAEVARVRELAPTTARVGARVLARSWSVLHGPCCMPARAARPGKALNLRLLPDAWRFKRAKSCSAPKCQPDMQPGGVQHAKAAEASEP